VLTCFRKVIKVTLKITLNFIDEGSKQKFG